MLSLIVGYKDTNFGTTKVVSQPVYDFALHKELQDSMRRCRAREAWDWEWGTLGGDERP